MNAIAPAINRTILGKCEEVLRTFPTWHFDLIVTDPPYGMDYGSGKLTTDRPGEYAKREEHFFKPILGDEELPIDWLADAHRVLKPDCAMYAFCHWRYFGQLAAAAEGVGFEIKNMIVMNKSNHGLGDLDGAYAPKHELCMFAVKGRHILKKRLKDVQDVPVIFTGAHRKHPNEKPVKWVIPFIENSSNLGGLVLDPFCGSGTVGYACKQLHRKYVQIELDPEHWATAVDRCDRGTIE